MIRCHYFHAHKIFRQYKVADVIKSVNKYPPITAPNYMKHMHHFRVKESYCKKPPNSAESKRANNKQNCEFITDSVLIKLCMDHFYTFGIYLKGIYNHNPKKFKMALPDEHSLFEQ